MSNAELIFWIGSGWIAYVYFGYPAVLWLASKAAQRKVRSGSIEPTVTVVIAAFNEEKHIAATVSNKLQLDYPTQKLDVIVVSDGSTDRTDALVTAFNSDRVRLIRQEPRQGKTAGLNLALREARGEIVVFSDANSIYERNAVRSLVGNFADRSVGYVTGKMVYTNPDGSLIGDGCSAYMKYENALRALETSVGSVVGVDGGVDAVRRELFTPMNADQLPDFVLPLRVVESRHRVVYEPRALLYENALNKSHEEFRMRVRVSLRSFWALWDMRTLLAPWRDALFAWQLWSHKVLRYLIFLPMLALLIANPLLYSVSPIYAAAALLQVLVYLLAALGVLFGGGRRMPALISFPSYLVLVNLASLLAFVRFVSGQKQVMWKPRSG